MDWHQRPTLITGGASFIGSHLVDALVARGAQVRVVDNLSSGKLEYIEQHIKAGRVQFILGDLLDPGLATRAVEGMNIVFHLAACHGGRGYIELHKAECCTNLILDGQVFLACKNGSVEKIVYASSACVYPNYIQRDPHQLLYLSEEMVGPPYEADNPYGWAKLMGEITLSTYVKEQLLKGVSLRYFTVYGERCKENQALMAIIARAFIRQDPFEIWGDGQQIRSWTHVNDVVEGTILAAERIDDGSAINLGTMERVSVLDAVEETLNYTGHKPTLRFCLEMPTGSLNRVANNTLAQSLLNWSPKTKFRDGLHKTIDWYFSSKNPDEIRHALPKLLFER